MLVQLAESLDFGDELSVLLALDANSYGKVAHEKGGRCIRVFCHGLKVGNFEAAGGFVENVGKILGHEAVETLESAESEDPVVRWLIWYPLRRSEVGIVAEARVLRPAGTTSRYR